MNRWETISDVERSRGHLYGPDNDFFWTISRVGVSFLLTTPPTFTHIHWTAKVNMR